MIKFLWSIPLGIIGLLILVLVIFSTGTYGVHLKNGAIDVIVRGWLASFFTKKHWGAFTFGWTIFYWGMEQYNPTQQIHERVHIRQYKKWGIIFPFLYLYYNITKGYRSNPLEVEAYKEDGRG